MSSSKNPYVVPVHDLVHRPGEFKELSFDFPAPDALGEGLVSVPSGEILENNLTLQVIQDGILARGHLKTMAQGECSRCLGEVRQSVQVEFCELFAYSSDDACEFEIRDDALDLEQVVRDAVVLALPFQPVCRDDCAGLNPETGQPLEARSAHVSAEAIDPRWSALQNFAPEVEGAR